VSDVLSKRQRNERNERYFLLQAAARRGTNEVSDMKQVIVVRMDLKMSVGKLAAQACHASLGSYNKASVVSRKAWELVGAKKVVLGCKDLAELRELEVKARAKKLPHYAVTDAGHTEVPSGTVTALGIGPASEELIDSITGSLKLL